MSKAEGTLLQGRLSPDNIEPVARKLIELVGHQSFALIPDRRRGLPPVIHQLDRVNTPGIWVGSRPGGQPTIMIKMKGQPAEDLLDPFGSLSDVAFLLTSWDGRLRAAYQSRINTVTLARVMAPRGPVRSGLQAVACVTGLNLEDYARHLQERLVGRRSLYTGPSGLAHPHRFEQIEVERIWISKGTYPRLFIQYRSGQTVGCDTFRLQPEKADATMVPSLHIELDDNGSICLIQIDRHYNRAHSIYYPLPS